MLAKTLGLVATLTLVAGPALAEWKGSSRNAALLITHKYAQSGIDSPQVADTAATFEAGGVIWRVFTVSWKDGGFRHVAVHRDEEGRYLAIEGLEKEKRWSQAVSLGR